MINWRGPESILGEYFVDRIISLAYNKFDSICRGRIRFDGGSVDSGSELRSRASLNSGNALTADNEVALAA